MSKEAEFTLRIAQCVASSNGDSALSDLCAQKDMDWLLLKGYLSYHCLIPFAYVHIKEYAHLLPKDFLKVLNVTYYYALRHAYFLEQEFLSLHALSQAKGICFIPIKGMALLEDLYSDLPVRQSMDIDVLVQEENIYKIEELLEKEGFRKNLEGLREEYWRKKQYHFVFTSEKKKSGFSSLIVEVHWDLDYPRKKKLVPGIFSRLRNLRVCDRDIKVLSVEDTFFSLILHQRHFGKILCLRDACDVARLLQKYRDVFDWEYVLHRAQSIGAQSIIFFMLHQIIRWLNADIPREILHRLRVPGRKQKLIKEFIEKNTFLRGQNTQGKNLYLKAHFLWFDTILESLAYIANIPEEQFAKFYGLEPYTKKTNFCYGNRLFYIPYKAISKIWENEKSHC